MDKKIGQYSLVDLLEVLEDNNHSYYSLAKSELASRNPSERELEIAKNGLEIRIAAKNKSLNSKEKLNAYLIPFHALVTGGSGWNFYKRLNLEFQKQCDEFTGYGELKKAEEFKNLKHKVATAIPIFIMLIIVIGFVIAYVF